MDTLKNVERRETRIDPGSRLWARSLQPACPSLQGLVAWAQGGARDLLSWDPKLRSRGTAHAQTYSQPGTRAPLSSPAPAPSPLPQQSWMSGREEETRSGPVKSQGGDAARSANGPPPHMAPRGAGSSHGGAHRATGGSQQGCRDGGLAQGGAGHGHVDKYPPAGVRRTPQRGRLLAPSCCLGSRTGRWRGPLGGKRGTVFALQRALGKQEGWDPNPRRCAVRLGRGPGVGEAPPTTDCDSGTGRGFCNAHLQHPLCRESG